MSTSPTPTGFRALRGAASLKLLRDRGGRGGYQGFRALRGAASLKPETVEHRSALHIHRFRALRGAASLKPEVGIERHVVSGRFPRPSWRGLIEATSGPGQVPGYLRALPLEGEQDRSRCLALATHARGRLRGRVGASMPGPAKAPDAGEGRASEPVAEARTNRRLPTTLHYGGNRMREARDRIHVRRDVIKCLAPCAKPAPCAGPSANPAPAAKTSASAAPAPPRSRHPASGPGTGSSRRPARPPL